MIPSYPTLGFDPAPGDPDDVSALAGVISGASESMAEVDALLVAADQREWLGEAAVAFRDLLAHQFAPRVAAATEAFGVAQDVISTWSIELRDFQARARRLEAEALVAQGDVDRFSAQVAADPEDEQARHRLDTAQAHRDGIQGLAWSLKELYETRGAELANSLGSAISLAPTAPTLAVAIALAFQQAAEQWGIDFLTFGDETFALVMMASPALAFLSDALGVASLLPIPVLSGVLSTLGLVASVGPLLTEHRGDWLAVVTDESFIDDVIGVAAGLVGLRFASQAFTRVDDAVEMIGQARDVSDLIDILTLPIEEGVDVVERIVRGGPWIQPPEIVA
ncbi:hypothetical protein JOF40_001612 [Aeromicrobium fastidiosum]|nr:hypothetical protein [Aeromicrobium fastidiosum]